MIYGNMVGGTSSFKTCIIEDKNGNQLTGVVVDKEVIFTATDNDVREGFVYASNDGVSTGTKDIPMYYTTEGSKLIPAGREISIVGLKHYEFTKLQALICDFNTKVSDSVATEKVSINGNVYNVGSTDVIATVSIDSENQAINLGITNNGDAPCVIRYFTYKEEQ